MVVDHMKRISDFEALRKCLINADDMMSKQHAGG